MNYSDSERIASIMENMYLKKASAINEADFTLINTCGVRQIAEDRIYGLIHNLRKKSSDQKIILTGCIANRKDVQRKMKDKIDLLINMKNINYLKNWIIKELKNSFKIKNLKFKIPAQNKRNNEIESYLSIKPNYKSKFQAYVPVMTGCNNFCSYGVVPYARGREISRPADKIISEIKNLNKKGYKEIILLEQNVNSYHDCKINFAKLLKKVNAIPGKFWIRFISSHPKDMSDELIETIAKCKKVCEYVHLPIQAGNDKILEKMNRKYTAKHYLGLIMKIKKTFKKYKPKEIYSLNGDIIVGFPSETRKQFLDSAKIMKKVGYDMIFFGQFSPRPGTVASKMKDNISKVEKIRREKFLNEILKKTAFKNNQQYLGKTLEVLIDFEKEGSYFGKTRTLKNIKIINAKKNLIGKIIKVKIAKANIWNLEGFL